jgi:hypothetical protein
MNVHKAVMEEVIKTHVKKGTLHIETLIKVDIQ